ncbi:low molecular weight phosphotyrosine protein phosphatase [Pseudomonas syringae]|nr:low molecular weight phosphotyrosine protein phosphatase [Pseudomonas syringae]MBD8576875.1 low molecular weight phosphotyrosine protein phosphatase [Pseudomonas syringae]MBD8788801.1 low molecular weight phosphotyrosine protein phosphatase [Pseudomonas syringae]MBD8803037.1 low molecular weight phosphotyrosine protein phosphatase [Pseudomonas syringae]MBD8813748.1 low molecular weight phosphotyrosine protein phosphatase [Pseudomonas syringae]
MFSEVLVVCMGNICRSPMAEAMLSARLPASGVRVRSAGLHALVGEPMDGLARQVLHEHGVLAHKHQACQVERLMLRRADLILSMEHSHLQRLFRLAPEIRGRAFLIGQWQPTAEIADPYRRAKTAFEQTYVHLSRCVDDWLPYLQSGDPR